MTVLAWIWVGLAGGVPLAVLVYAFIKTRGGKRPS